MGEYMDQKYGAHFLLKELAFFFSLNFFNLSLRKPLKVL